LGSGCTQEEGNPRRWLRNRAEEDESGTVGLCFPESMEGEAGMQRRRQDRPSDGRRGLKTGERKEKNRRR
jgi:hypothetical protein